MHLDQRALAKALTNRAAQCLTHSKDHGGIVQHFFIIKLIDTISDSAAK